MGFPMEECTDLGLTTEMALASPGVNLLPIMVREPEINE
jgi:hypothetical protein